MIDSSGSELIFARRLGGASFPTVGALANSGTVAVGSSSTLNVSTTYTQSAGLTTVGGLLNVTGTLTENAGLIQLTSHADSAALIASAVHMGSGATLDITNRGIVIPYGAHASPIGELTPNGHTQTYPTDSIQAYIQNASDGGLWDNPGLTSSTAENDPFGLTAVGALDQHDLSNAEGSDYTGETWMGVSITSDNTVLVRETYFGDTDLDGAVDGSDVNNLELGFQGFGDGWLYGDFNYDGIVNVQDVNLLDLNYSNLPLGDIRKLTRSQANWLMANESGLSPGQLAAFETRAGVPEPASFGLIGGGAIGMLARRRSNRRR